MQRSAQAYVKIFVAGFLVSATCANQAGLTEEAPPAQSQTCPQDNARRPAPPPGAQSPSDSTSERLADTKGVICPPTGIDPEIRVKPPSEEGVIKTVPAPGTPGGGPNSQPK
jgi:hypothetical protein